MKNIFKLLAIPFAVASLFSCKDQLEISSPSSVDAEFVFKSIQSAKTVILGAYTTYMEECKDGWFSNFEGIGSDYERCNVAQNAAELIAAAQMLSGTGSENLNVNYYKNRWEEYYKVIAKCNQVIYNIENKENFADIKSTAPNEWSDLLGQAYCLRATCYLELTQYHGDCIYVDAPGLEITELSPRDYVLEKEIASVIAAEPLMFKVGQNGHYPDQMTRNYADGLIGRLCFWAAGYQTRRTDLGSDFYKNIDGNPISFEVWGTDEARKAVYERRTDWKKFYEKALPYLKKAIDDPGEVAMTLADPRSDGKRVFGNPFQYYFEQITKNVMPLESVYEIAFSGDKGASKVAYNHGRGCNGPGSGGFPAKANAQACTYPEVYYNVFDPQDLRRDASMVVTGSNGAGLEIINSFGLTNKCTGGIQYNKYDQNRQDNPDNRQLYSGINFVKMRQADIILMYAEALEVTGNSTEAEKQLRIVHDRAFPEAVKDAKFDELMASCNDNLYDAIIKERALELLNEGSRRWDLTRTGTLPKASYEMRKKLTEDMKSMKEKGYIQYDNGQQFPAFIWTKNVDARAKYGYRLTAQCPEGQENDPVLYPSWRGQHDNWEKVAEDAGLLKNITAGNNTNLAIVGLFRYIDPESQEAKDLEADGYKKTAWGYDMYTKADGSPDATKEGEWSTLCMAGYTDADYAAKKAPIHLIPMWVKVCLTTGLTNGYGFKSN